MKTDKNTVIGFALLGILFIAYFAFTNKEQSAFEKQKKHIADSIALIQKAKVKPVDPATVKLDSLHADSLTKVAAAGNFLNAAAGTVQNQVVENDLMKITFSNKGGQIKKIELKKYKSFDSSLVALGGEQNQLGYAINTSTSSTQNTANLFFTALPIVKNTDGSQTITYQLKGANGQTVENQFIVKKDDYMVDWNININGAQQLLSQNTLNLHWNNTLHRQQYAMEYEKEQSYLCYNDAKDGYDDNRAANDADYKVENGIKWLGFKQQFFNMTVLSKNQFKAGTASMTVLNKESKDGDRSVKQLFNDTAALQVQVPATAAVSIPLQLYYGPNDYYILKKYDNGMQNMVDLGSGIDAFAKYINRWIIIPVFRFIAGFVSNYGWAIILLTIFIRLITSPLTYKSYYSSAKMKVLRPELDELKKKHGKDQQGFAMEQMKLFREAGVNPLSGCMPMLLQIPIFLALYRYFNSSILLRGQSFLWAKDLSAYDSIIHFGTHVPLLGDHLSLFTITYSITSMFTSMYNMNMNPSMGSGPNQQMMKYMPYFMPFIFFFVFNGLPSALTLYYTVSNLVTLGIQLVIQKYILDHGKILAQINEKRKQPKKKSKFQARLQQMQEQQKKMNDIRKKN